MTKINPLASPLTNWAFIPFLTTMSMEKGLPDPSVGKSVGNNTIHSYLDIYPIH